MKCGGCGSEIDGPGGAMMEHYKACPQFAPDRVAVRRLERKLAHARSARDRLRAELTLIQRLDMDARSSYWHGRWRALHDSIQKAKEPR